MRESGWRAAEKRIPPHLYFVVSAVFHYLGPAFAVLLFAQVAPLGVAWLRIASAAAIFACWRRPWRFYRRLSAPDRCGILALGIVLALMNASFYLAIDRLPLGSVGAIEFLGPVALAAAGLRNRRNLAALALAAGGVYLLTEVRFVGEALGYAFAFANCALFVLYVVLGHRMAAAGSAGGIDRLAAAMLVAAVVSAPIGFGDAVTAFLHPTLLAAGIGVGITSSVVPYVTDQLAMARLPRSSFALLLSLLPATASGIGFLVLGQHPTASELAGLVLVAVGVALHRPSDASP